MHTRIFSPHKVKKLKNMSYRATSRIQDQSKMVSEKVCHEMADGDDVKCVY